MSWARLDWRKHGGGLLLVLFAVSQAYAVVHHSLVAHTVCSVDGELAHGDHDHGPEAHDPSHGEVPGTSLDSDEAGDEHGEHCSVPVPTTQRKGLPLGGPQCTVARSAPAHALPLGSQLFERSTPVYRLAPKQSPPRIA